LCITSRSQA